MEFGGKVGDGVLQGFLYSSLVLDRFSPTITSRLEFGTTEWNLSKGPHPGTQSIKFFVPYNRIQRGLGVVVTVTLRIPVTTRLRPNMVEHSRLTI